MQARQESTTVSDLVAVGSIIATLLTVLGTIIALLNKSREGSVRELTALLKLERDKIQRLEKANRQLSKRVQELEERLAKTIPLARKKRASPKPK